MINGDLRGQPANRDHVPGSRHFDVVRAGGAVNRNAVHLTIGGGAAGRASEIERDLCYPGPREVVDDNIVGASQGVEVNMLDPVEVHRDVADVAEEPYPTAISRDVDA